LATRMPETTHMPASVPPQHPPPVDRVARAPPMKAVTEQRDELGQAEEADDE